MKPIYLKLSGLNSYRDLQEIDFETLCEAGLFGIFGPTGSGKSSILDAITLALYGQVVRTGGGSHPHEVLNQLESRLFVSFTFELGGASQRQRFTIEREFGLNKNGNRKQPEVRLIQHGLLDGEQDQVLESKATAATSMIENLVGLTIHDFTRAVVLPQGQFSKFLTLKGSERNEMLQRIFHLHEYGEKLMQRVKEQIDSNKASLHQLEVEEARLGDASEEAVEAATQEAAGLEKEYAEAEQIHKALLNQKNEWEQIRKWQFELGEIQQKLTQLEEKAQQIMLRKNEIARLEASISLYPLVQKERQTIKLWEDGKQQLLAKRVEREQVELRCQEAEQVSQQAQQRLRQEEPQLIQKRIELQQAAEWEQEIVKLAQEIGQYQTEIRLLQQQIDQDEAMLSELDQQRAVVAQDLQKIDAEWQQTTLRSEERKAIRAMQQAKIAFVQEEQRFVSTEREATELSQKVQLGQTRLKEADSFYIHAHEKRKETEIAVVEKEAQPIRSEEDITRLREQLVDVKRIGIDWRGFEKKQDDWRLKWTEWTASHADVTTRLQQAEQTLNHIESKRGASQDQLKEWETQWDSWQQANMAHALRLQLRANEECPVCGSTHHPYKDTDTDTGNIVQTTAQAPSLQQQETALRDRRANLDHMLEQVEEEWRSTSEACQQIRVELAGLLERKDSLQKENAQIDQDLQHIKHQLIQLGEEWVVASVDELGGKFKQVSQEVKELSEQRHSHVKQLDELQKLLREQRDEELEKKAQQQKITAWLEGQQEQLQQVNKRLLDHQKALLTAEQQLDELRGEIPRDQIEAHHARMEKMEQRQEELRTLRVNLEKSLEELQQQKQVQIEQRGEKQARLTALHQRYDDREAQYKAKQEQWQIRTQGRPANELLQLLEQNLQELQTAAEQADTLKLQLTNQRQQLMESLVSLEETNLQLTKQAKELELEVEQALSHAMFADRETVYEYYERRALLGSYQTEVESYQKQLTELAYAKTRLVESLADRSVSEESYNELYTSFSEGEQRLSACREALTLAKERLLIVQQNHEKWKKIEKEFGAVIDEQSRLEELRKLFEGKAFVQYIAEEKMMTIARDATYHLGRMTKGRYALEIGDGGEFVLRDEAAGGLRRAVNTLSGGETFLTALSLALALSVEIQMRGGRLEFFFLDEGFGTLDPELLEVVLDALEKLRMSQFTIGLISHVPELKLRMPRRLVITPAEPLGSGSRIHMEME
ncbi:nuclease [Brevibacillus laterosporus]|uniref:Nuclease SbcCD subunit C n=1 Tax=Brevibacillus laterosporus LMG 15441 TaxID=1042163 RepID=A0A075R9F6_BRELA|nr:AAA family ATPase [Brevibacillus laterosporus]AIG28514.1 nuclease SbcCD subunit C [Brevibacillus laterosporus LMG 15441]RJL13575.1 nuclease [Brevibacillus laterosporus]TPH17481.1 nuclease [Brevibacillus laterosporus]HAS00481.1 nuclease [Brevibacillus sp.]